MIKYRPLLTNIKTQGFKCNPGLESFYESIGMKKGLHGGTDWGAKDGEKVYFDCDCEGFVLNTEIDNNGGLGVNIITESGEGIYKHRYWHLKGFNVVAGQKVESGDLIGYADNTGLSTGTHLHCDIKEMIKENGAYKIKYPDNGTFGTIDYSAYFKNIFILDYISNIQQQVGLLKQIINILKQIIKWY